MRRGLVHALGAAVRASEANSALLPATSGAVLRLPAPGSEACRSSLAPLAGGVHAWSPVRAFASGIVYPPPEAFVGSKAPDFSKVPGTAAAAWLTMTRSCVLPLFFGNSLGPRITAQRLADLLSRYHHAGHTY
jgi:hypothetical protein